MHIIREFYKHKEKHTMLDILVDRQKSQVLSRLVRIKMLVNSLEHCMQTCTDNERFCMLNQRFQLSGKYLNQYASMDSPSSQHAFLEFTVEPRFMVTSQAW